MSASRNETQLGGVQAKQAAKGGIVAPSSHVLLTGSFRVVATLILLEAGKGVGGVKGHESPLCSGY